MLMFILQQSDNNRHTELLLNGSVLQFNRQGWINQNYKREMTFGLIMVPQWNIILFHNTFCQREIGMTSCGFSLCVSMWTSVHLYQVRWVVYSNAWVRCKRIHILKDCLQWIKTVYSKTLKDDAFQALHISYPLKPMFSCIGNDLCTIYRSQSFVISCQDTWKTNNPDQETHQLMHFLFWKRCFIWIQFRNLHDYNVIKQKKLKIHTIGLTHEMVDQLMSRLKECNVTSTRPCNILTKMTQP